MRKIIVNSSTKSYPVVIGENIFKSIPELIGKYKLPNRIFVIIDSNIDKFYGQTIRKVVGECADKKFFMVMSVSESLKSLKSIQKIFSNLHQENFGRDTLLIVIGGGILGDLGGFCSSIYMRGTNLIQIPTTLLSAVDSSIGGKNGVNFHKAKNLIGTFYPPSLVLIDTNFLKSLSRKELISGFGEVIKYAYLNNSSLYSTLLSDYKLLKKNNTEFLNRIIYESVKVKSAIVSDDEFEKSGLRKILNFGHTFAHAFESNSGYRLSHGKAVIAGIVCSLILSFKSGLINHQQLQDMLELPLKFKSAIKLKSFNEKEIFRLMSFDKKNRDGQVNFVLIKNFGEMLVDVSVEKKLVYNSLKEVKRILV